VNKLPSFLSNFVKKNWTKQKQDFTISCFYTAHIREGEQFYLLFTGARGPYSFEDLQLSMVLLFLFMKMLVYN
jgi:hypothetical protein